MRGEDRRSTSMNWKKASLRASGGSGVDMGLLGDLIEGFKASKANGKTSS
ncbi:hypothetical protein GCM10023213_45130 [Prosthecobacter algae]|uniref:Uncharacterized protein n=1 Tax=Prosthecobacter algae TaxID=1144682 RepID=A0ABP9PLL1_9BACT